MRLNIRATRTFIIAAIAALWTISMATAQPVFVNPPCGVVNVTNTTPFPVQFNPITLPAGAWPVIIVPAGGTVPLRILAGGTVALLRVVSCANAAGVPFNPPPPPAAWVPPCSAGAWWIPGIALPPTCNCFNICAHPPTCSILIWGATTPPPACLNP